MRQAWVVPLAFEVVRPAVPRPGRKRSFQVDCRTSPIEGSPLGWWSGRTGNPRRVGGGRVAALVESTRVLGERGFDNQLLVGVLTDGREVLLRQSSQPAPSPAARATFLSIHDVGAPHLYAANDTGAVLVDFVPGETLAAMARRGGLGDREWRMVGAAYRRIHAVQFPAPLRGHFGPERLELTLEDPVDLLHSKVEAAEPAVHAEWPVMVPLLDELRRRIDARADELRQEAPCLAHTPTPTSTM